MQRFEGKVAIVTGGSGGIGAATVARLVSEGAKVVNADLAAPGPMGNSVKFVKTDATLETDVAAAVADALHTWGRLDVLVNNAGKGAMAETPDMAPELWDDVFAINTRAIYLFCRAAIPLLRLTGGTIVNVASISGLVGDYGAGAYNASKGAVVNYTRSLALDCARDGIRVNALCPGLIETNMTSFTLATEQDKRDWENAIPLGRVGTPDEMAGVIAFLASADARYMTGSIVAADGGITAHTGLLNGPARVGMRGRRQE